MNFERVLNLPKQFLLDLILELHTPTAYLKAFTIKVSYNKREMKDILQLFTEHNQAIMADEI